MNSKHKKMIVIALIAVGAIVAAVFFFRPGTLGSTTQLAQGGTSLAQGNSTGMPAANIVLATAASPNQGVPNFAQNWRTNGGFQPGQAPLVGNEPYGGGFAFTSVATQQLVQPGMPAAFSPVGMGSSQPEATAQATFRGIGTRGGGAKVI